MTGDRRALAAARYIGAQALELTGSLATAALWLGADFVAMLLLAQSQEIWTEQALLPGFSDWALYILITAALTGWTLWLHYYRARASALRFAVQFIPLLALLATAALWLPAVAEALRMYERAFYIVIPGFFVLSSLGAAAAVALRQRDLFRWLRARNSMKTHQNNT